MYRWIIAGAIAAVLAAAYSLPATGALSADRHTCADYAGQAAAQAAYRADPVGLARLDADRDGIACESRPAPRDTVRVPR